MNSKHSLYYDSFLLFRCQCCFWNFWILMLNWNIKFIIYVELEQSIEMPNFEFWLRGSVKYFIMSVIILYLSVMKCVYIFIVEIWSISYSSALFIHNSIQSNPPNVTPPFVALLLMPWLLWSSIYSLRPLCHACLVWSYDFNGIFNVTFAGFDCIWMTVLF